MNAHAGCQPPVISTVVVQSEPKENYRPIYRPDIDGLRAVAVLAVIIFHAFPYRFRAGFVGVDVFFVISGYLISNIIFHSLQRGDFSFTEFYAHRVKRIFPALIVVLVACYIFGWFALLPDEYKQLGKHMAAGAGFAQNIVLWKEAGYFEVASELKPLMHLWSLAVEEQFYLLYPLLIWSAWRIGFNVLTVVVVLGLLSFGLNLHDIGKDAARTFFLPQTRLWELLAGAALAHAQFQQPPWLDTLKRWTLRVLFNPSTQSEQREAVLFNLLAVLGGGLLLISALTIHQDRLFPGKWALLPVSGTFFLIMAGPNAWINRRILSFRPVVYIGLISYPLYLWHWPLLSFTRIMESDTPSRWIRLSAVALAFLLAWITYRLVEKPIRFGKPTWIKTAALVIVIAIVGYVGYNAYERDGLVFWKEVKQTHSGNPYTYKDQQCMERYPDLLMEEEIPKYFIFCRTSRDEEPTILLVGDSHANHLFPGIAEMASGSNETVTNIGGSGCMPFFNAASLVEKNAQPRKCIASMQKTLSFVENNNAFRVLVLAHSYKGKETTIFSDGTYESAMRETLSRLLKKNKRIIFVLDNPSLNFDIRSCIDSRPLRLTNNGIRTPCAVSRQVFDDLFQDQRNLVARVLKDFPEVELFDVAASFCDDQRCWAMKDDTVFYGDWNHLSGAGSSYVAKRLWPLLVKDAP